LAIKSITYAGIVHEVSYQIEHPKHEEVVLFLHGWGSNKLIMHQAFNGCFSGYKHLYIDLPGFGDSPNNEVLTSDDYLEIVRLFLRAITLTPKIIIGHSFGGKLALRLDPEILILLSSAGIVQPKRTSVKVKIALFKFLKPFGGTKLRQLFATKDVEGMAENMYETLKNVVDEDYTKHFKAYHQKAFIFWGIEDNATPLRSGEAIHTLIKGSQFFPMSGDHFFFLQHAQEISKDVLGLA
jgi:hypothetical protein